MTDPRKHRPKVVVVGAGFGGFAAARALAGSEAEVTVVDRNNHHLFQPLLYQVATAMVSPEDVAIPTRAAFRRWPNIRALMAEVTGVDLAARTVKTTTEDLAYDHLVLAPGSTQSYFGHDDWAANAPGLKSLADAMGLRRSVLEAFERAEACRDDDQRRRLLTFVLVGAGPTGVELAGALADLARRGLARDFRRIDPGQARIVLVEALPAPLAGFADDLQRSALRALRAKGVEVRLDAKVEAVDERGIRAGGDRIDGQTVIWTAGVQAAAILQSLGVETDRKGRIRTNADFSVPGHAEVTVIGDAALVLDEDGRPLPGLAAVAKQQGAHVGRLIRRRIEGRPDGRRFRYRDYGSLATLGRWHAVAQLPRLRLTGRPAWLFWSVVHLYYLSGFRNRTRVLLNWIWSGITAGRGAQVIVR